MLTHARLLEVLDYNPQTGVFTWKIRPRLRGVARGVAGAKTKKGYWRLGIDCRQYYGHRVAWFYVHGVWPARDLDHQDRDPLNNAIGNLRLATMSQNQANRTASGGLNLKGVTWDKERQKYMAKIKFNRKIINLGRFANKEDAHAAYCEKARELFGEFHAP